MNIAIRGGRAVRAAGKPKDKPMSFHRVAAKVSRLAALIAALNVSPVALADDASPVDVQATPQQNSVPGEGLPAEMQPEQSAVAPAPDAAARTESHPAPVSPGIAVRIATGAANGQRYPDSVLRVVEPSAKTLDVGLALVGALLGSFRLPLNKEEYRGSKIENVPHPAHDSLVKSLLQAVSEWQQKNGIARSFDNPVFVRPDTFALVYADYQAENPAYDLLIQTTVSRKPDSAGWFTAPTVVTCTNRYDAPALPLEQWQADDYAAVLAKRQEHVANCIETIRPALAQLFAE